MIVCQNFSWFDKLIFDENGKRKLPVYTPIAIQQDKDYFSALNTRFQLIEDAFGSDACGREYLPILNIYHSAITSAVSLYLSGDIDAAIAQTDIIIKDLSSSSNEIGISTIKRSAAFADPENVLDQTENNNIQFFRARTSDHFTIFSQTEMLHIPFDKRHLVGNERFSITGFPCLYLASSSYCCWLEIGTPADHQFNVSPFRVDGNLKILNLAFNYQDVSVIVEHSQSKAILEEVFKLWLLSIATSITCQQRGRNFKTEYIFSQLIMISCKKAGLDGVSYYSKKVKNDVFCNRVCVNVALFATYDGEDYISKICNKISAAPSYNYSMFKQLTASQTYRRTFLNVRDSMYPVNIGDFDRQVPYCDTLFYEFDQFLFTHVEDEIKPVDVDKINSK